MSPLPKQARLPNDVQQTLLKLARNAIVEAVCHKHLPGTDLQTGILAQPAGVFVTLRRAGHLRGCIGNIESIEPLVVSVATCAVSAALYDPRFMPVVPEEVERLEIEISVLSPPVPIQPEAIDVGRHGLIVKQHDIRSVLLPQVASERAWTPARFLEEICCKAGLPADAWKHPDTQLFAFESEIFREADFEEHPPNLHG
jgi:AmmeMemoRadiSam system protein A